MKIITKICLTLTLLCSCLLSGCSGEKPIEKMKKDIYDSRNCQMTVQFENFPFFRDINFIMQVDDDILYTPVNTFTDESYVHYVDDKSYQYYKNPNGQWEKLEVKDDEESITNQIDYENILKDENFEKIENTDNQYKLKKSFDTLDIVDMIVTINDDSYVISGYLSSKELNSELLGDNFKIKINVIYDKIGDISLSLPEIK